MVTSGKMIRKKLVCFLIYLNSFFDFAFLINILRKYLLFSSIILILIIFRDIFYQFIFFMTYKLKRDYQLIFSNNLILQRYFSGDNFIFYCLIYIFNNFKICIITRTEICYQVKFILFRTLFCKFKFSFSYIKYSLCRMCCFYFYIFCNLIITLNYNIIRVFYTCSFLT